MTEELPLDDENLLEQLSEDETLPEGHKSGFVAVIGRPNVGKSTLMNAILGEKIAIVSPKPQTTRFRQLGIYTRPNAQIVFVDTPGLHEPRTKLGEYMVSVAVEALRDADVILWVVDASEPPTAEDRRIAEHIAAAEGQTPLVLVLNKADRARDEGQLRAHRAAFEELAPASRVVQTVATQGVGVAELVETLVELLPEGPRYYPADQLSDTALRDIVAEIIREKALLNLEQEVPHGVATQVEEFKQRNENLTYIAATLYVERESHKGIVIGKGGQMLKRISQQAREEIERLLGTRVYLELWVKVLKGWRKNEAALRRLGYRLPKQK